MMSFDTPQAAALAFVDAPGAVVVASVVEGDLGGVVVRDGRWSPPVERSVTVRRERGRWWSRGGSNVGGAVWGIASPDGSVGDLFVTFAVGADVESVTIRVADVVREAVLQNGYALVVMDHVPADYAFDVAYTTRDGVKHDEWPGRPASAPGLLPPGTGKALDDARHWVWATQRQVERFVIGIHEQGHRGFPATADEQRASSATFADAQFLLNAAHHATKALSALDGISLSDSMVETITVLRNVHEHWEQQRAAFERSDVPKKRSGKAFAERYPESAPWSFSFGADGHHISVLRLEDLWAELDEVDRRLSGLFNEVMADSGEPHQPEDVSRPPRPMPVPDEEPFPRVVASSVTTQDVEIAPASDRA